jgi:hypothetical protein
MDGSSAGTVTSTAKQRPELEAALDYLIKLWKLGSLKRGSLQDAAVRYKVSKQTLQRHWSGTNENPGLRQALEQQKQREIKAAAAHRRQQAAAAAHAAGEHAVAAAGAATAAAAAAAAASSVDADALCEVRRSSRAASTCGKYGDLRQQLHRDAAARVSSVPAAHVSCASEPRQQLAVASPVLQLQQQQQQLQQEPVALQQQSQQQQQASQSDLLVAADAAAAATMAGRA